MSRTSFSLVVSFGALIAPLAAGQTTWYVSPSGDDMNLGTSQSAPLQHLTFAVETKAAAGDTVRVLPGTYDVTNNGESFPIDVPTDITIEGYGVTPANQARIGGDVGSSSVAALFGIDGTSTPREDITIRKLAFVGEDTSGVDAPSAIVVAGGEVASVTIEQCGFQRGEMNDASTANRATIHVHVTDEGTIAGLTIRDNRISATALGAIEVSSDAGADGGVVSGMTVEGNLISNPAGTTGRFAFRWNGEFGLLKGAADINGNTFTSTWSPSTPTSGLIRAIDVHVAEFETSSGFFRVSTLVENVIRGFRGDALHLTAEDYANITIDPFDRNQIVDNGGSGIVIDRNPDASTDDQDYVFLTLEGNVIANNGGYGIVTQGAGGGSTGALTLTGDTVAHNGDAGIAFTDWGATAATAFSNIYAGLTNVILWENDGGGDQVTGLSETDTGVTGGLECDYASLVSFCDWQDFATWTTSTCFGSGNIDDDPDFVAPASTNFHLSSGSPCIDAGNSLASTIDATVDIDLADRFADGDFDCVGTPSNDIDIGADEVPTPDCP